MQREDNEEVKSITLTDGGAGYASVPTVTVGNLWANDTSYGAGTLVYHGSNLYRVLATASSATGSAAPTHTSGTQTVASTELHGAPQLCKNEMHNCEAPPWSSAELRRSSAEFRDPWSSIFSCI